jgi:putative ABC transport system substrate-binding protein
MKRRDFIRLLGGAAAAWPPAAGAQQADRIPRVGVFLRQGGGSDPQDFVGNLHNPSTGQARLDAFQRGFQELGWMDGRNVRIDYRFADIVAAHERPYVAELIGLRPDVILFDSGLLLSVLEQASRTLPIVFVQVPDPNFPGSVPSLERGDITGFTGTDYTMAGKWLELLRQIAPGIERLAILYWDDPANYLRVLEPSAQMLGIRLTKADAREATEVLTFTGAFIEAFAREPNGALLVLSSGLLAFFRDPIMAAAAEHRLPTISGFRFFTTSGALLSYGPDPLDLYRRAASYVDRILKGERPADLPVQAPVKFDLVINMRTAKAIGVTVPPALLTRADELIE